MRQQLRTFALVWVGITVIMGACTFVAIYSAYGALSQETDFSDTNSIALPPATDDSAVALAPTGTLIPTRQAVAATASPTSAPAAADAASADAAPAVAAAPTLGPTPLPVDDVRFQPGIQVQYSLDLNPENQDMWMREVSEKLNLEWYKQQVRWEDYERERGQYDWTVLDLTMPSAARFGLKVMLSIVTAPDWAREAGVDLSKHGPPADFQDYVNFVTAIVERYPGMVHGIEVWNEQNLDREWTSTGGLSAANYVTLLRQTYQAVKNIDPGIIVISGALSPTGLSDGVRAWDDFVYMDQMIQAGMLNYTDCVGVHHNGINVSPDYRWDAIPNDPTARFRGPFDNPHHSWSFRSTLEQYANKIALAGGKQKLCITEFGWASTEGFDESVGFNGTVRQGFEFALDNSLQEQRDFTVAALQNMADWGFVRLAFLWNLNYGPQAGWDPQNDNVFYSIIGPGFLFRPVFDAVRDWNRAYEAQFN